LLDDLHWHGVAMVEFKQDAADGLPKLMEINGRFWGSLQLAIDAGVDFPALLVSAIASPPRPQEPYRVGVRSRWFWGDVDSLLTTFVAGGEAAWPGQVKRRTALAGFVRFRGANLHYDNPKWDDPWPWAVESAQWLHDAAGAGLSRLLARASRPVAAVVATTPARCGRRGLPGYVVRPAPPPLVDDEESLTRPAS
jgi:predicted ATP-grasp superfamily ATP-dependent carboligase